MIYWHMGLVKITWFFPPSDLHTWNHSHALLQMIDGKDGQVLFADDGFLASGKFWLQGDLAYLILLKEYK